jgi:serine protease Do
MVMCSKFILGVAMLGLAWAPLQAQPAQGENAPARKGGRAYLGVGVDPTPENAKQAGLIVREVEPGGPAAKAGIKTGDLIVKVDGKDLRDFQALASMVAQHKPGDQVTLSVWRDGKSNDIKATLQERPRQTREDGEGRPPRLLPAFLGVESMPINEKTKEKFGVTAEKGAIVAEIFPGTPAAKAGLKRGDVITRVAGQEVDDPMQLRQAVQKAPTGKDITITVVRGKEEKEMKARLSEFPEGPMVPPFGPGIRNFEGPDRISQLERRIEELEKRIRELEGKKK